ncbi:MAG: DNA recombination protein RmuC [Lachnospiraceae bacterium]|nr:DNA recombination protein RmuC [Lachnospiraceae bacterium]
MEPGIILIIALLVLVILFQIVLIIGQKKNANLTENYGEDILDNVDQKAILQEIQNDSDRTRMILDKEVNNINNNVARMNDSLNKNIANQMSVMNDNINGRMNAMNENIQKTHTAQRMELNESFDKLRQENQQSMDKINDTVNEKLQKTLNDRISKSFENVQNQLAEVYKGLGEMKDVASGVGDLKKVLSNVKTRGIVGEYQLEAILQEILTPEQYETQFTLDKKKNAEKVDFAIKLPGLNDSDEEYVYLPIDSKFPGETYGALQDAYDTGDVTLINNARNTLATTIKNEAKSISTKYIIPPITTDFAVMFLPFEGLYAEVVNMGLIEELQNKYKINVAGPSTMAAMLNSFRMGFRTLAIQKKSGEVWKTLEATKTEFEKFEKGLDAMKKKLTQADTELDKLIGVRTRAINRTLKNVSTLENPEDAEAILEVDSADEGEVEGE